MRFDSIKPGDTVKISPPLRVGSAIHLFFKENNILEYTALVIGKNSDYIFILADKVYNNCSICFNIAVFGATYISESFCYNNKNRKSVTILESQVDEASIKVISSGINLQTYIAPDTFSSDNSSVLDLVDEDRGGLNYL
jgi:hypothetical protein